MSVRTGIADLPLHYGRAPRWLFERMTKLAREITIAIVDEYGAEEMLRKLADTFWFQAFGCVLGFDWHSSGVTTTVCGALKEGLKGIESDLGLYVAGGKGATSRRTPGEIMAVGEALAVDLSPLVYASRLVAKVDNNAVQDGYQIYHHAFIFTARGQWAVVQQGMTKRYHTLLPETAGVIALRMVEQAIPSGQWLPGLEPPASRALPGQPGYARRYHWLGAMVRDFVCEPHAAVVCDQQGQVLNLVAQESDQARDVSAALARENPEKLIGELKRLQTLEMPARHPVLAQDLHPDHLRKILLSTYDRQPENFEVLLGMEGVGAKTLRALSLISEVVHGVSPSFRDPARFSFAHGGKDGYPYPVDRVTYDRSIETLRQAIAAAKVGQQEKLEAFKRLATFTG